MTADKNSLVAGAGTQTNKKVLCALEMIIRALGLVNGTITITARGGQLCRGVEVVNKVDVALVD
jgi:hypothetical protein